MLKLVRFDRPSSAFPDHHPKLHDPFRPDIRPSPWPAGGRGDPQPRLSGISETHPAAGLRQRAVRSSLTARPRLFTLFHRVRPR